MCQLLPGWSTRKTSGSGHVRFEQGDRAVGGDAPDLSRGVLPVGIAGVDDVIVPE